MKETSSRKCVSEQPFEMINFNPNPFRREMNISKERTDATAMENNNETKPNTNKNVTNVRRKT